MSYEARIVAIDEEAWWWFLEVLPPRWMSGNAFAFAEGYDRFRLFWQRGDEYFVRQLSATTFHAGTHHSRSVKSRTRPSG